ncbi:hypothetical protein [Actinacidiphila sp. ITFR-21]|uniref:hypothetical protein n=1 Tax=Actinacidiphila sp. ITFR-21 TaxID=3075199 RepID=UPI0028897B8B|nr:hypothetical protein [Streptomyces sp. ITFR-21]WNI19932.1 hypothetical protein RLT57_30790 [Streptomyces sp. ITFR-21]
MTASSYTPALLSQLSSLVRLGPVTLIAGRHGGRCRCLLGPRCNLPGEHTMAARYWTTASRSPADIAAQFTRYAPCGLGVILPSHNAVLQVPGALQADLADYLDDRGLAPPTVHGPERSWVWLTVPSGLLRRYRTTLPPARVIAAIGPGGWVPVPPTTLGTDAAPLIWRHSPTGHPLTPERGMALVQHLGERLRDLA